MLNIKRLYENSILLHKDVLIKFIFESNTMTKFMDAYTMSDAERKWSELLEYVRNDKAIIFGAEKGNVLFGFVWAYENPFRDDSARIYISILHVDSNCRKQHIGEKLLVAVEQEAKKRMINSVYLHVEALNEGAIRFYHRMGFHEERMQLVKKEFGSSLPGGEGILLFRQ